MRTRPLLAIPTLYAALRALYSLFALCALWIRPGATLPAGGLPQEFLLLVLPGLFFNLPPRERWDVALRGCPPWAMRGLVFLALVAAAHVVWGIVLPELTHVRATPLVGLRMDAAFSLFFHALFAGYYWTWWTLGRSAVKCPRGHNVAITDAVCLECGATIRPATGTETPPV